MKPITPETIALLSEHAASLFACSPPGEPSPIAGALADLLADHGEHAKTLGEKDTLAAELATTPAVNIVPDPAGRLVCTITGRGVQIVATQSRADSGNTALLALQRLAGLVP